MTITGNPPILQPNLVFADTQEDISSDLRQAIWEKCTSNHHFHLATSVLDNEEEKAARFARVI